MGTSHSVAILAAVLVTLSCAAGAQDVEIDPATGLKKTGDWELVRNNCIVCHSTRLVAQQRGSTTLWLDMIRWMQQTQNLWQFDAETEERIVTYLAENYPPDADRRRAPIPRSLMPPNPYATETAAHE